METGTAATHEEIWDDSMLVESWNQALEEYKKYHSIHAKGGSVDEILNGANETVRSKTEAKPEEGVADEAARSQEGAEAEADVEETIPMDESDETSVPTISDVHDSVNANKKQGDVQRAGGPPLPGPQTVLGTVQDDELKNLLMSWYYAGYYTGLYEGRQQRSQQAQGSPKTS
ncbi:hypothetical protein VTH82DRAFT_8246 [Thermothelomyces myriococcoides]